jgi:hypothetical protein
MDSDRERDEGIKAENARQKEDEKRQQEHEESERQRLINEKERRDFSVFPFRNHHRSTEA